MHAPFQIPFTFSGLYGSILAGLTGNRKFESSSPLNSIDGYQVVVVRCVLRLVFYPRKVTKSNRDKEVQTNLCESLFDIVIISFSKSSPDQNNHA